MRKIRNTCVGCHYCALECPVGAISYGVAKYEIDPDKCVECGLCESICPTGSVYDDVPKPVPEAHPLHHRRCDLLVCGGGTGLITAVRGAQLGLKVVLVEKAGKVGGNTTYAHGFFPVYTCLHREKGLKDNRDEAVEEFYRRGGGILERDVLRTAVYGGGEFFDWLYGFPGAKAAFDITMFGEARNVGPIFGQAVVGFPKRLDENLHSNDPSIGPGWTGTWIKNAMLAAIGREKLDVEILTEHAVKKLLTDDEGNIRGAMVSDPGGETEISAKAVVLATGGMGRSDEKLQKYFGFFDVERPVTRFSVPGDTGDAIDLLEDLGVSPDEERLFLSFFGPAHHPYSYGLYRIHESPLAMNVDLNGKRWENEEENFFMGRFRIGGHPKEVSWGIYEESTIQDIADAYYNDPSLAGEKEIYARWREDLSEELTYPQPPVCRGDTISELARSMGIDPAALTETVDRYNEYCRKGNDPEFGKNPDFLRPIENGPFWAIYGQRFSEGAFGGLRVDDKCRVTKQDGSVIPGLYGVGDATSAMHRRGELAIISELTWACASAFVSAENAVRYIKIM